MVNSGMKRKPFNMTLDEDLVKDAKKRAIDVGKPLYEFVEDALWAALGGRPVDTESIDTEERQKVKSGVTT